MSSSLQISRESLIAGAASATIGLFLWRRLFLRPPAPKSPPPNTTARVVITGGTKGLGLALTDQILSNYPLCRVFICGRDADRLEASLAPLRARHGDRIGGTVADVSSPGDVDCLWTSAVETMGGVDVFVCNAALAITPRKSLVDTSLEEIEGTLGANLLGPLYCARKAIKEMPGQGGGVVYFVDGDGARSNPTPGNATYGLAKIALVQLAKSLWRETAGTNVAVHVCSPGMMPTDLLVTGIHTSIRTRDPRHRPRVLRILNALVEDTVDAAAWLSPRILSAFPKGPKEARQRYDRFLTPTKAVGRILWALTPVLGLRFRNRFFDESQ